MLLFYLFPFTAQKKMDGNIELTIFLFRFGPFPIERDLIRCFFHSNVDAMETAQFLAE